MNVNSANYASTGMHRSGGFGSNEQGSAIDPAVTPTKLGYNVSYYLNPGFDIGGKDLSPLDDLATAIVTYERLANRCKEMGKELCRKRTEIFEVLNPGTVNVSGKMKADKGETDRDDYIKSLAEYVECQQLAAQLEAKFPQIISERMVAPHHTTSLYGDMMAFLKNQPVPDLVYNKGSVQMG